MAKYYSSTFGKISGKHGTAVAVIMKDGSTYLRKYTKPSNPRTEKQQAHRAKFALSSKALVPFNPIFKETMGVTNGISMARSYAFKNAIVGEYPSLSIDYEKLMFSFGALQKLSNVSSVINEGIMTLNWDFEKMYNCHGGDAVNLVVFNKDEKQALHFKDIANRSDRECKIDIRNSWSDNQLYVWAYLKNGDRFSDSIFVGDLHGVDNTKYDSVNVDRCVNAEYNNLQDLSSHSAITQAIMAFVVMIYNLFGLFRQVLCIERATLLYREGITCSHSFNISYIMSDLRCRLIDYLYRDVVTWDGSFNVNTLLRTIRSQFRVTPSLSCTYMC